MVLINLGERKDIICFQKNKPPFFERLGILMINNESIYIFERKAEYYLEKINFLLKSNKFSEPVQLNITEKGDCLTTYKIDDKKTYLGYYDLSVLSEELQKIIRNLIEISEDKTQEINYEKALLKKYLKDEDNGKKIYGLCLRYIRLVKKINEKETKVIEAITRPELYFKPA